MRWIILGAGILVGVPALFIAAWNVAIWLDNRAYAGRVFDGVVDYRRVLASELWVDGIGCSVAVVELGPDVAAVPPTESFGPGKAPHLDIFNHFGGNWQPTPVSTLLDPQGDGDWVHCKIALGAELYGRLADAVARPGGWWIMDMRGDHEIHVYSPAAALAFRLREGD